MKKLKAHPLADRWPTMSDAEFEAHKLSVAAIGQTDPIILLDGMILDGRHRYRACNDLGIKPKFENWNKSMGDPVELVIAKSSHRNMSPGQKAWSAAQFDKDLSAARKAGGKFATPEGKSRDLAALRFGVSEGYVNAAKVLMKDSPTLFAELGSGKLNVNQAMTRHRTTGRANDLKKQRRVATGFNKLAFGDEHLKFLHGDVVDQLNTITPKSVDVAFTDPPYDLGVEYHGDESGDRRGDGEFALWCETWITSLVNTLADHASLFVMLPPRHTWHVHSLLLELGLSYRNTIFWYETFGSHSEGNLTSCCRPILYFTRRAEGFIYNTDLRVPSDRQSIYGDARANPAGKTLTNVWQISRVQGTSSERVPFDDAPPQLPIEIPERCIRLTANPGGLALDPFNGNGTTAVGALRSGLRYVGIDQSAKYIKQARSWIPSQLTNTEGK